MIPIHNMSSGSVSWHSVEELAVPHTRYDPFNVLTVTGFMWASNFGIIIPNNIASTSTQTICHSYR